VREPGLPPEEAKQSLPARLGLATVFGVAFATGLSGAVMPGPLLIVDVQEALKQGAIAGPLLMIGHGLLELAAILLLILGLIRFARSPAVTGTIGLLGGLILIWLAHGTLTSSGLSSCQAVSEALAGGAGPSSAVRTIILGAVMSLANPYWWLWWATVGVSHIAWASRRGGAARGLYFSGHLLSDVAWYTLVAFVVGEGKGLLLLRPAVFRGLFLGCGIILALLGLIFLRWGLIQLRGAFAGRRPSPAETEQTESSHAPGV
jgi:threonine/homoserine/homoserine lactone efflux protein